ncbi:hypothetical protein BV25DRAFT_1922279 [Artomyces pyxidatus]|uniref:Uncharacterized protein n=1 Tax=Artomyces pyxidatus TaxID=48021 RepID=A0ACB8SF96_9AGAM|nr:hypothetical protein BV25DRAFT_1922279 [Artomyces pyxidatus]
MESVIVWASMELPRAPSLCADGTRMWGVVVRADVAQQLVALDRAENEEEIRMRREPDSRRRD